MGRAFSCLTCVCWSLLAVARLLCVRGPATVGPHVFMIILNYVETHVCAHIPRVLSEMRATMVCVHSMMLDTWLSCTSSGTWLCVAACGLILAYMLSTLVGRAFSCLTCVCVSLLAVARLLCARGPATVAPHVFMSVLKFSVTQVLELWTAPSESHGYVEFLPVASFYNGAITADTWREFIYMICIYNITSQDDVLRTAVQAISLGSSNMVDTQLPSPSPRQTWTTL